MDSMMNRSKSWLPAVLLIAGAATGCTRANELGLAPLDQPADVVAKGAQSQSQLTLYSVGTINPAGSLLTLQVKDASVHFSTTQQKATVQELVFKLGDADVAPTQAMPNGVHLRNQELRMVRHVDAPMVQKEPNALTVRAHTTLQYHAAMILDDGTLYTLGSTETEPGDIDIRATRYEFGVHITVDAAPPGKCLSVPGLIEVSNCALYVSTDGDAVSND